MAAERGKAVSSCMVRKMLWRSKSLSRLQTIIVLGDHDDVVGEIRDVGAGHGKGRRRAEVQVAARLAAAVRESAGGSSAAHLLSIVFTPGFF